MIKTKQTKPLEANPTKNYVPLSRLRNIINKFEGKDPQTKISFEFLIGSCFPTIYENINEYIVKEYMRGYTDGKAVRHD